MSPNNRGPIYATVQAALQRVLTPDERNLLDRFLDGLAVPRRGR